MICNENLHSKSDNVIKFSKTILRGLNALIQEANRPLVLKTPRNFEKCEENLIHYRF